MKHATLPEFRAENTHRVRELFELRTAVHENLLVGDNLRRLGGEDKSIGSLARPSAHRALDGIR